jgi:iron-sulfur cluster insertion protein
MTTQTNPITLTEKAATKIVELLTEENDTTLKIRCFVSGGGCSGMQYGFDFDETVNDDDYVTEQHGARLLVDSMSYQYLIGAEIDYKETEMGSEFVVRNPNAVTTCGCGSSFSAL